MEFTRNKGIDEALTVLMISGVIPQALAVGMIAMIVYHPIISLVLIALAIWGINKCLH